MNRLRELTIYSPAAFSNSGHSNDYVSGLAAAFLAKGVEVQVIGWDGPRRLPSGTAEIRVKSERPQKLRSEYRERYPNLIADSAWGIQRVSGELRLMKRLLQAESNSQDAAVLFETFEYLSLAIALRASKSKATKLAIFHDTNFSAKQNSHAASAYKLAMSRVAKTAINRLNAAFVHGPIMRENLISTVGLNRDVANKVHSIPYGAPSFDEVQHVERGAARKRLGLGVDDRVLLAFGTLRKDKRFDVVFDALKQSPKWRLLIVGPAGDLAYEELRQLAAAYGVTDRLTLVQRFIPADEQSIFFGAADCVVNIYHESVRHESGTAQRARCFMRPVIVGGAPDLAEYVASTGAGWFVDVRNPMTLGDLLNSLENASSDEWARVEGAARSASVGRSWHAIANLLTAHTPPVPRPAG